jgi:hypothetical protein
MRLWSDTHVTFGNDHIGYGIIIQGGEKESALTNNASWEMEEEKNNENGVLFRLKNKSKYLTLRPPYANQLNNVLRDLLKDQESKGKHPAFTAGFSKEAKRLFPDIDSKAEKLFSDFVDFLNVEFGLTENCDTITEWSNYADGFGPNFAVIIDNFPILLPVLPIVYEVPTEWLDASYFAITSMYGPNVDLDIPAEQSWYFTTSYSPKDLPTEGLFYFQVARAMVAWAAWENDPSGRFLTRICDLVMSGYRPLPYDN